MISFSPIWAIEKPTISHLESYTEDGFLNNPFSPQQSPTIQRSGGANNKSKVSVGNQAIYSSTTYYVDATNGSDANDGLMPEKAWKTINKVNNSIFMPRDSILFKRGETWRENLKPPSSGSSGNPITFSAYGSGAKPIISGGVLKNTFGDWTEEIGPTVFLGLKPGGAGDDGYWQTTTAVPLTSNNLWYLSSISTDPGILVHDGTLGLRKLLKTNLGSQWDYWWDDPNDRLYVYSTANPTTLAANIEIGARDFCVSTNGADNITFSNIDFRHARSFALSSLWGSINWTIDECDFSKISKYCMQFHNGSNNGIVSDCTFTDWGVIDGQQYAIQVIAFGQTETGPVDITGCTFALTQGANVTECMPVMQDNGGWIRTFSNNTVNGNRYIKGSGIVCWRPASIATSITIDNNTIKDVSHSGIAIQELEVHGASPTVLIRYNLLENTCLGDVPDTEGLRLRSFTSVSDVTIAYNIINVVTDGANTHHGIQVNGGSGAKIWNNIIYASDNGIEVNNLGSNHSIGLDIRNNIVIGNRGHGLNLAALNTITSWGYNCWYNNTSGTLNGKAAGIGDVTSDPKFASLVTADFHLLPASPCINAGVDVGLTQDYEGNSIRGLPDIGAFEFSGVTSSLTASATSSPTAGQAPLTVNFTGNATGGTSPYSYSWNFGDGQSSSLQNPSHIFSSAGTYNVFLRVTDSKNATDTESLTIVVTSSGDTVYVLSISSATGSPAPGQGGTTEPAPGNYSYTARSNIEVKSVANADYRFSRWVGDIAEPAMFNTQTTVTMDKNKTLSGSFCAKCGDVNGDLKITPADAQKAFDIYLKKIQNPTMCELENADVNCSGTPTDPKITPADAQAIFNKFLEKADLPPGDCSGIVRTGTSASAESLGISQTGDVHLVIDEMEASLGKDILIPILADSSFPISAFGFDLAFPSDILVFIGIEGTDYTERIDQIGANTISEGVVRVGGYATQPVTTPSPAALVTLVFRVIGEVQAPTSFSIINTCDGLRQAQIRNGIIRRQVEKSREGRPWVRRSGGKSYDFE